MSSILNDVKHTLGLFADDTSFDQDVIIHINTVFGILSQLGVGPVEGFAVTGPTETWDQYTENVLLNPVKSYIYLRVKLMFDPPGTGFVLASYERQITELETRLNWEVDF